MISYLKFKEIFADMDSNYEPEFKIYFNNRDDIYMIIKYNDYVTFQRCGTIEEQSSEIKFKSLDELCNTQTIDDIVLINEWDNIEDIWINCNYSVVYDREVISDLYGIEI